MISGRMRHPVDVQQVIETRSGAGEVIRNWVTKDTVWANIWTPTGREFVEAQQVAADVTHKVRMRWYDGLTPSHRLQHDGRVFNIRSVANIRERGKEHELVCSEEV